MRPQIEELAVAGLDGLAALASLEDTNVRVSVPDLPTHRSATATLADDAEEVRRAIRSCSPPVVVVGWSYGGKVISMAALGEPSVVRLVYVADIPAPPSSEGEDDTWVDEDPHILAVDDGMFVLNNDWWVNEEAGTTFSAEVQQHCRKHPRRPAARTTLTDPQTTAAWQGIATTVLAGQSDNLLNDTERQWATEHIDEVQILDTDHFIIFHHSEVVANAVLDAVNTTSVEVVPSWHQI